ncbi:Uma2 family endonuclease [Nocardiopsis chromatogenes]|uniref:Uma2 family endonuclease n=1 Tax=Nocardiopsis chromatogenes TaxID=280239 RepID=UPI0004778ECC|nr:Uma2 family endonuclease [Nocardiopsis chromatogenes]
MAAPLPEVPFQGASFDLQEAADTFTPPDGFRVEIIEGKLVVSPTPLGPHLRITSLLQDALKDLAPGYMAVQHATLTIGPTGERYIPDLVLLPEPMLEEKRWKFPSHVAALAVEVTSPSNADTDRVKKLRGYALGEAPAYLLIDTDDDTWTLFEEPQAGVYRKQTRPSSDGLLHLPAPFTGPLDCTGIA